MNWTKYLYLFIYLLHENQLLTLWAQRMWTPRKEARKKDKGGERRNGKGEPPTPTRANDAFIGDKEQIEKQKEKKKETGHRATNPATLDPSVASYDPQGSHGETILLEPPTTLQGGGEDMNLK